jgi:hypothetical protein
VPHALNVPIETRPLRPLLATLRNFHGPLNAEKVDVIAALVANPSPATWDAAYTAIISTRSLRCASVWQFVLRIDPTIIPGKGSRGKAKWPKVPDRFTIGRALQLAAAEQADAA